MQRQINLKKAGKLWEHNGYSFMQKTLIRAVLIKIRKDHETLYTLVLRHDGEWIRQNSHHTTHTAKVEYSGESWSETELCEVISEKKQENEKRYRTFKTKGAHSFILYIKK